MPVEILGGAGDDHVGAVLQRPEVDRAGKGGVDQQRESFFLRDLGDRAEIDHPDAADWSGVSTKIARVDFRSALRQCRGWSGFT